MRITNETGVSLPLAVWLAHDEYDYVEGVENYISVTTLMKPLRQIILPSRIPPSERQLDVTDFIAQSLGHAIHDSIEKAWKNGHARALRMMGYGDETIGRIAINPTDEERRQSNSMIPVYLEQRAMREINVNGTTYTIGGKFDMVAEGIVNDFKSTSVWSWIKGSRDDEHKEQGSLYRWIHRDKITEDYVRIHYIFTDWSKSGQRQFPNYPRRIEYKDIPLLSIEETEQYIRNKLALIQKYKDTPEAQLPECTDEELWRSSPVHKYFSDPEKAKVPGARSSKNFDDAAEARRHMAEKGGKGIVITQPGEVKRCGYCAAYDICTQKDRYL